MGEESEKLTCGFLTAKMSCSLEKLAGNEGKNEESRDETEKETQKCYMGLCF